MKKLIGNILIAQLKPAAKAYDIWDTKLTGFILRVLPSGAMVYRCEHARGKRITLGRTTVLTPVQARDKAKQILSQAAIGLLPTREDKKKKLTLKDFIDREYEPWRKANRKNGEEDSRRLKINFVDELGGYLLHEIPSVLVEKWRTKRINSGRKTATINRDIVILKAALNKAVEWGFIEQNPLSKLKPHRIDSIAKVRYLAKDEEHRLKNAFKSRDNALKAARSISEKTFIKQC